MQTRTHVRIRTSPLSEFDLGEWDPSDFLREEEVELDPSDVPDFEDLGRCIRATADRYGIDATLPQPDSAVLGEEVGDDRVDISGDPLKLAAALTVQEKVLLMVTSQEDTTISHRLWNFCEVTGRVPCDPGGSFQRARKVGDFTRMEFTDVPPLRIIIDTMKGDRSHSSTTPGKVTMLGSRMRTPRSEFLLDWYLASYLQDGLLHTSRSTEPKYLPQIMGGSGVRAPWGVPDNLYLSVCAYRGGSCRRIYGSATNELRMCVDNLERGRTQMPILCHRLRDKHEYLHGTFADKILVPTRQMKSDAKGNLPAPLVMESEGSNRFSAYENRLVRTRHVVTRRVAEREWAFTERILSQLLDRVTPIPVTDERARYESGAARKAYECALHANTAFSNLLSRCASGKDVEKLIRQGFLPVGSGLTEFRKWDSDWLFNGGRNDHFSIDDLTLAEDLFLRSEVCEEECLRVGGIPLRPVVGRKVRPTITTSSAGLYQIGQPMIDWADGLTGRLVELRAKVGRPLAAVEAHSEYIKDPEWVNDDSSLIGRCLSETQALTSRTCWVCLVSGDRRLAHQMSDTCNVTVARIDPLHYVMWCKEANVSPGEQFPDVRTVEAGIQSRPLQIPLSAVYVDSGSVASALTRIECDETELGWTVYIRTPISSGVDPSSQKRYCRYSLKAVPRQDVLRSTVYRPTLSPKRFRSISSGSFELPGRRSRVGSRSSGSWR